MRVAQSSQADRAQHRPVRVAPTQAIARPAEAAEAAGRAGGRALQWADRGEGAPRRRWRRLPPCASPSTPAMAGRGRSPGSRHQPIKRSKMRCTRRSPGTIVLDQSALAGGRPRGSVNSAIIHRIRISSTCRRAWSPATIVSAGVQRRCVGRDRLAA
jgi:hypothetical protein